jgi:uncharacterized repeat protein (TIGR02543 family)
MMPNAGSNAIGTGVASVCAVALPNGAGGVDQRGYTRSATVCTSGAVDPFASSPGTVTHTLSVTATFGGQVDETAPATPAAQISACANSGGNCSGSYAEGTDVTLSATADTGYTFTSWGGDCSGTSLTTAVTMNGDYSCTAEFTATPLITIVTQPADLTVTQGAITQSLSIAATVNPSATPSYQWYSNTSASTTGGTPIAGATGTDFALPTDLVAGTYYYYCVVSATGAADVTSNLATVTVKDPTTMTLTASPNPARSDQPITLTATVYGDPPTGIVTFYDANGTIMLGTVSLSPVNATSSQAMLTVGPFTAGSIHALNASYEGDGINVSSASKVITLAILRYSGPGATVSVPALGGWALLVLGIWMLSLALMFLRKGTSA